MAKKQSSNRRTQVKELPRKEKQLSAKESKSVKGGRKRGNIEYEWKVEEGESAPKDPQITTKP